MRRLLSTGGPLTPTLSPADRGEGDWWLKAAGERRRSSYRPAQDSVQVRGYRHGTPTHTITRTLVIIVPVPVYPDSPSH